MAISPVLYAKKSLSSCQLERDLRLNQKTTWGMETCIRQEMAKKGVALLHGSIETDETYIGGKPCKAIKKVSFKLIIEDRIRFS